MAKDKKKNKKTIFGKGFDPFNMNRNGKGVEREEDRTPNLIFFFKQFVRKFPKLLSLNLIMLLMVVPILVAVLIYLWGPSTPVYVHTLSAPMNGIAIMEGIYSGATDVPTSLSIITNLYTMSSSLPMITSLNMILITLCGVVLFVTWGWQNVGVTYILRGLVRGDAVFLVSDYFYAIKRNLKQGLLFGMADFSIIAILVVDYLYLNQQTGITNKIDVMFFMVLALALLYFIMRFYMYLMLVTFDIKIGKIFKHALIFSVLGIKRNIMALIGIFLLAAICLGLFFFSFPIGLSVTIVTFLACAEFIKVYAAYPVIEKYMIEA